MTFFATFIIIYEDKDLPEVTSFMPTYWNREDVHMEGDYYHTNANSRWNSFSTSRKPFFTTS